MTIAATEVKNHFGQYLEEAILNPVFIQKTGRSVAVMLSVKEYERLTSLEDAFWAQKAALGEKSGYLGKKKPKSLLTPNNMLALDITRQAKDFLEQLDQKQFRQVVRKIFNLLEDLKPGDAKPLQGYPFWRADVGEYRIIYRIAPGVLKIALVDKRNDDEVYKKLRRL